MVDAFESVGGHPELPMDVLDFGSFVARGTQRAGGLGDGYLWCVTGLARVSPVELGAQYVQFLREVQGVDLPWQGRVHFSASSTTLNPAHARSTRVYVTVPPQSLAVIRDILPDAAAALPKPDDIESVESVLAPPSPSRSKRSDRAAAEEPSGL